MKNLTAWKVITNLLQNFDFLGMVIFRRKNICGISTENYVLCSFELENDPIFRICAIRMDLRKNYDLCPMKEKHLLKIFQD
jgi:hypothetical protein